MIESSNSPRGFPSSPRDRRLYPNIKAHSHILLLLVLLAWAATFATIGMDGLIQISTRPTETDDASIHRNVDPPTDDGRAALSECLEREALARAAREEGIADGPAAVAEMLARCNGVALPSAEAEERRPDLAPEVPAGPERARVAAVAHSRPAEGEGYRSAYDIFRDDGCIPSGEKGKKCYMCLRIKDSNKKRGNCGKSCEKFCGCFCKNMCQKRPEERFVSKTVRVHLPPDASPAPARLIPRIVYQTWFEPITTEKYPNMSRLIESWKRSGWDYQFFDDEASAAFLSEHFPPEVREAYDTIVAGAFKADLFRYCVLLIQGGVYADMDILLESNLDQVIDSDVGFMVPVDDPGSFAHQTPCLWNGLLASAPGHPFLAKAVELVVNNVRNRFTTVDYDNMLCPDPNTALSHGYDVLYTAGPCILGAALNSILRKHMQDSFRYGELDLWKQDRSDDDTSEDIPVSVGPDDPRRLVPGRAILLKQDKQDMGAHRFTLEAKNLIVAATDMPDYDDRQKKPKKKKESSKKDGKDDEHVHYAKSHVRQGIYGLDGVYKEGDRADEELRFVVVRSEEKGTAAGGGEKIV